MEEPAPETEAPVDDGADNYGEYLASTGVNETFVTFANIDYKPINGSPVKECRVKVWRPIPYEPPSDDEPSDENAVEA